MNKNNRLPKIFLLIFTLLFVRQNCYSQDTSDLYIQIDTTWNIPTISLSTISISSDYSISHDPSYQDSMFCKKHSKLINAEPTKRNHSNYYSLACSLWELGRLKEAEKMFLKIIDSKEPYYVGTYYNSSDIPGDTTTNSYGYGSYTSNFKNYACRYLTRIYIEEKKFDQALTYIEYTDKKYIVEQNCGTGFMWYRGEINGLYSLVYEGLGMNDSIINMFLPQYPIYPNKKLIRALQNVYSQNEINEYLKIAESSMVYEVDTFNAENYAEINDLKYTTITITMSLFGRQVTYSITNFENEEIKTRDFFTKEFKESEFYNSLIENE